MKVQPSLRLKLLKKEQPDIALPSFGIPIGLLRSITIIELGMLFTLFYFWLYYRDARSSRQFPLRATLFGVVARTDRKSTRLNSSHGYISYAVFCLKKKIKTSGNT